jgi:DNA-binding GntR family transcriptional regulator
MSHQQKADRPTSPIIRRNLGSDVYSVLWDRILSRDLFPGEKLSDLRLSEELGVSRTPVREALHRLVQDGVVIYSPNRGFFVASFSGDDIGEIFDLRAVLEALALRTLAARLQPSEYEWARGELERAETLIDGAETDEQRLEAATVFLEVDQGFHQWLIEGCGNQRLTNIVNGLWAQVSVFQRAGTHVPGWMEIALQQHKLIIDLLIASNGDEAADALEHHILDMKTRVIADFAHSEDGTIDLEGSNA